MATAADVADAVVETIDDAMLPVPGEEGECVKATRVYQPDFELTEMEELHVTVVARGVEMQPLARGRTKRVVTVDVAVMRKFAEGSTVELDPLCALVEQIAKLFSRRRLQSVPEAVCTVTKPDPLYAPEHMEQLRQFTSVLTLTVVLLE